MSDPAEVEPPIGPDDPDAPARRAIRAALGRVAVDRLVRLTGGASRATWRCTIDGEPMIVQCQRAGAERDMAVEAALLRAAATAGVAVPELVAFEPGAGDDPPTLITRFVPGETIARRILRDDGHRRARGRLVEQLGRSLARLHQIEPETVAGLEHTDPLQAARERLDELGQPHPAFELAFRWLADHRPPTGRTTVVHGDYRLGNVIVDADGLAAVIDWELVHVGDPMEDLGWSCVPAWRFGSPLPAAGVGTREALIAAYEDESGWAVDPAALRWWEVCGIVRWGVICVMQAETHRSGVERSHELAAIGRRVCETEHDLFLALDGRW